MQAEQKSLALFSCSFYIACNQKVNIRKVNFCGVEKVLSLGIERGFESAFVGEFRAKSKSLPPTITAKWRHPIKGPTNILQLH